MTLISQIISDAYRQSNLLALGTAPTTAQQDEGLRYLNRIIESTFGNEAGEPLRDMSIGNNNVNRQVGDTYEPGDSYVLPANTRLVLNLTSPATLYLSPSPEDGDRFAVVDVSGNLATNTLTIEGNGRKVEGASSLLVNTDGLTREWFYRQDLGAWVRITDLLASDELPFPKAFDDYFITMLAMRLNPAYGVMLDDQSSAVLSRSRSQLRSRYNNSTEVHTEIGLIRLSRMDRDRDYYDYGYDSTVAFNRGFPW